MTIERLLIITLAAVFATNVHATVYTEPEQIHLSYGATPDRMIVTWVTLDPVNESMVEFGDSSLNQLAVGSSQMFVDGGSEKRSMCIHRVQLTNLVPGKTYRYHCGSKTFGWSNLFFFTAMKSGQDWSPRFAVFGDMGNLNAQSLTRLQEETLQGMYDAILHVGDFAYNMDDDNARVGDEFMKQIESVAGYLPYMTCPGNHEERYNFSNYVNRFSMPNSQDPNSIGGDNNHFFSVNIGPVHLLSFSSEFYYYIEYGLHQMAVQYDWIVQDLKKS